jgi:BirA family biotin operon repressor/biotin-[acetyl-CoA-carboxylase] ligase
LQLPPVNHSIGIPFIELQSIDSTNNYALARIHANLAQPGTCFFTHEQTAGKGRRGKVWASEKDANIAISIVLQPLFLQPFQQFYISACVAVATYKFLLNYTGENLKIKWPNDLYWENKKLGGILIENIIQGKKQADATKNKSEKTLMNNWKWCVAGIGININQTNFPPDLKNPVSLKNIAGIDFNPVDLAKELCISLDNYYKELIAKGPDEILKLYNHALYKKDQTVKFKKGNRKFEAVVKNVDASGRLTVQHGIEELFEFGEIEWEIN